jgi:hypothetical protein
MGKQISRVRIPAPATHKLGCSEYNNIHNSNIFNQKFRKNKRMIGVGIHSVSKPTTTFHKKIKDDETNGSRNNR